jgi:hypothetical protein
MRLAAVVAAGDGRRQRSRELGVGGGSGRWAAAAEPGVGQWRRRSWEPGSGGGGGRWLETLPQCFADWLLGDTIDSFFFLRIERTR